MTNRAIGERYLLLQQVDRNSHEAQAPYVCYYCRYYQSYVKALQCIYKWMSLYVILCFS